MYPWLQVQLKPPGTLMHAALVSQILLPSKHSLISSEVREINSYFQANGKNFLTITLDAIPTVSLVTGTHEATKSVNTLCISVTIISILRTLINI